MFAFTFVEITSDANYLSGVFGRTYFISLYQLLLCVSLHTSTAGISEKLTPQITRVLHESVVYMAHGVPGFKSPTTSDSRRKYSSIGTIISNFGDQPISPVEL